MHSAGIKVSLSGDYYRRISKPNASFVSEPIAQIAENGVRTTDGVHHELDAVALATDFQAHNYMRRRFRNSWYFADDNHIDPWPFDRKRLTRMLAQPRDDDYILAA
ncbi:hypothetical protein [Candidatus Mycobacterium methanotrophicum]|uniref:Uncharacterized protein n=1 Tax=Candidatus Mycobacterium methanotrophicum TaxID=2943498 RepID=A0ABY4QHM1_9MYCO|nr:hypothetical protein [Candidatus Mycobacterium methanotrophicum]UQX10364.1 hypothetical protein M5I08_19905 [Candidatus Mycobacterium methanotrophicum]